MIRAIPQERYRRELKRSIESVLLRVEALKGLDRLRLDWRPSPESWSIAQVLEHLVRVGDGYLERIRERVGRAPRSGGEPRAWRPSLAGWLFVASMRSPVRLVAPAIYRPGPHPRPDVVEAFAAGLRDLGTCVDQSIGLDWRRLHLSSPVSGLIRFNLGDCFGALVAHAERHMGQIARLQARADAAADPEAVPRARSDPGSGGRAGP